MFFTTCGMHRESGGGGEDDGPNALFFWSEFIFYLGEIMSIFFDKTY